MSDRELVRQLRDENEALREQNAGLRQLVAELGERNAQLREELTAAEERISELEQARKGPSSFIKPSGVLTFDAKYDNLKVSYPTVWKRG